MESYIDVALRIGNLPGSALMVRSVGEIRWMGCARPDYLTRRGEPRTPADLSRPRLHRLRGTAREWPISGANGIEQIAIGARFSINTAGGVIGGAIAALGIATRAVLSGLGQRA
jgi:DNA-binding transcriptional LysR family regulator